MNVVARALFLVIMGILGVCVGFSLSHLTSISGLLGDASTDVKGCGLPGSAVIG